MELDREKRDDGARLVQIGAPVTVLRAAWCLCRRCLALLAEAVAANQNRVSFVCGDQTHPEVALPWSGPALCAGAARRRAREQARSEGPHLPTPSISLTLAFLAGLLSFVSPCVLPLVPVYLGYLSGSGLSDSSEPGRWRVLAHAGCFVTGFTLVFAVLFGLPTTLFSGVLQQYSGWITRVGGALLILFGLHTMGVVTIPILNVTRRPEVRGGRQPGYIRSTLIGATFAAGWTPCIGPLLGTVMTMAFTGPGHAIGLMLAYAMGLAIPFLLTAALLARAVGWLRRVNRYARVVEIGSGVLMAGVGLLLVTGTFARLNSLFSRVTPDWLLRLL